MLGVEAVCSAEAVSSGGWDVKFKQAVVVRCASDRESFVTVWCERVAVVGVYVSIRCPWCLAAPLALYSSQSYLIILGKLFLMCCFLMS